MSEEQNLQPDGYPTPVGMLELSEAFTRLGYLKLARYLRWAGDRLAMEKAQQPVAILKAQSYGVVGTLVLTGDIDAVQCARLGHRYALVPVDGEPLAPTRAPSECIEACGSDAPCAPAGCPMPEAVAAVPAGDNWR